MSCMEYVNTSRIHCFHDPTNSYSDLLYGCRMDCFLREAQDNIEQLRGRGGMGDRGTTMTKRNEI